MRDTHSMPFSVHTIVHYTVLIKLPYNAPNPYLYFHPYLFSSVYRPWKIRDLLAENDLDKNQNYITTKITAHKLNRNLQ